MKIYIDTAKTQNNNKVYVRAYVDLGYRKKVIAVGEKDVAEFADMSPRQLLERLKKEPVIIL